MLLVIYGHTIDDRQYRYLIYAFHMPFFFFLSGMLFHPAPFRHFLKRSTQTLLIPYLFLAAATYGIGHFTDSNPLTWARFWGDFWGVIYGSGANGGLGYNIILWFLPCLFVTRMLYYGIQNYAKTTPFIITWLFFFSGLGFAYTRLFPDSHLPFGLETAFTAVVFFGAGALLMEQQKLTSWIQSHRWQLLLVSIPLWLIAAQLNFQWFGNQIDMRIGHLNNYALFYIGALAGILMTVILSMLINANRVLEYIGKHTLALLGWQFLAFLYIYNIYIALHVSPVIAEWKERFNGIISTGLATTGILAVDYLWHRGEKLLLRK